MERYNFISTFPKLSQQCQGKNTWILKEYKTAGSSVVVNHTNDLVHIKNVRTQIYYILLSCLHTVGIMDRGKIVFS